MNPRKYPINQSFAQGLKDMQSMKIANGFKRNGIKVVKYLDLDREITGKVK